MRQRTSLQSGASSDSIAVRPSEEGVRLHVAIIMDGNGRWASARGLPRIAGHRAGADAVRRVVEAAADLGIGTLTLYAFSSDNWKRPVSEVSGLMKLLRAYLKSETPECIEKGIRIQIVGRRDRLDPAIVRAIERAESTTRDGMNLTLRIAIDYSARDLILVAAAMAGPERGPVTREVFAGLLGLAGGGNGPAPDVDLLIRTAGEQRLSDFLLWECAYAEFMFVPTMWPDFGAGELARSVDWFHSRERRFGALPEAAVS